MSIWLKLWSYFRGEIKIKASDIWGVIEDIDVDGDGYISLGELIKAIGKLR